MFKSWVVAGVIAAAVVTSAGVFILVVGDFAQSAHRATAINHMKVVALACQAYEDSHKRLPTPKMLVAQDGRDVETALSWRVSILGYLGQEPFFQAFDTSLAWDDERNAPFQERMPAELLYPKDELPLARKETYFQYFTGPGTLFPANSRRSLKDIKDGAWKTLLFAEAERPVIWTQPADMAIAPDQPLPVPADRFLAALADGSVRMIERTQIDDAILRQLIDPNDGKPAPGWDAD